MEAAAGDTGGPTMLATATRGRSRRTRWPHSSTAQTHPAAVPLESGIDGRNATGQSRRNVAGIYNRTPASGALCGCSRKRASAAC